MTQLDEILARLTRLGEGERKAVIDQAMAATKEKVWVPNVGPQTQAYFCEADELLYGGQAGGGKTDLGVGLSLTEHRKSLLMRRYNMDARKLAERVAEILGHRNGYTEQLKVWRLPGGRVLDFGGCEYDDDKQRYKGTPHDLIFFDELVDFLESQYTFIIGWNRSVDPKQRCRVVAATNPPTNPEGLWVLRRWGAWLDHTHPNPAMPGELRWYLTINGEDTEVDGPGPHMVEGKPERARSRTFLPASLEDNPDLVSSGYSAVLANLPEELRRAYKEGDWTVGQRDGDHQVIPTAWINAAQQRWTADPPEGIAMTAMAVDVAPGGGDERVIACRYGGWYAPLDARKELDKTGRLTAGAVVSLRRDNCPVVVDLGGGWGGDATVALKDNGIHVVPFNGVEKSRGRTRDGGLPFVNKRAEAIWKFREELDPTQEGGSAIALPPDPELRADLASYRWTLKNGGILIEPKEKIKERIGRSPDKGDAVVMCLSEGDRAVQRKLFRLNTGAGFRNGRTPQVIGGYEAVYRKAGRRRHAN